MRRIEGTRNAHAGRESSLESAFVSEDVEMWLWSLCASPLNNVGRLAWVVSFACHLIDAYKQDAVCGKSFQAAFNSRTAKPHHVALRARGGGEYDISARAASAP